MPGLMAESNDVLIPDSLSVILIVTRILFTAPLWGDLRVFFIDRFSALLFYKKMERTTLKSDYMQYISENEPDQYENDNPSCNYLECPDSINTVGIIPCIMTNDDFTIRVFNTGFVTSGFFLTGFHAVTW